MSATTLEPPPIDFEHLTGPDSTVLEGVSWEDYESLDRRRDSSERRVRLAYLNGVVEMMPPVSDEHEGRSFHLGHLVAEFCLNQGIDFWGRGTTTLQFKPVAAMEPDEQFYFHEKGDFPDLVIEVAISTRGVDKLEAYRKIGVPEVWIWRQNRLEVHGLTGVRYDQIEESRVLPGIDLELIERCAKMERTSDAVREFRRGLE